MKKYTVVFTYAAECDIDEIIDYIALDNPTRAISFVKELRDSTVNTLEIAPNGGTKISSCRFFAFGNYVVIYDIDEENDTVIVHMVIHSSREWRALFSDR